MSVDSHEALAQRLEELLEVESFPPPTEFARDALLNDPAVYEQAAADPLAWWEEQARELDWFSEWDTTLDDSNPPFYKWFIGGTINASHNCLDRHIEAGIGDRVALHWRGEEGEERDTHLRRPAPRRPALRQRAAATRASSRATSSGSTCR